MRKDNLVSWEINIRINILSTENKIREISNKTILKLLELFNNNIPFYMKKTYIL